MAPLRPRGGRGRGFVGGGPGGGGIGGDDKRQRSGGRGGSGLSLHILVVGGGSSTGGHGLLVRSLEKEARKSWKRAFRLPVRRSKAGGSHWMDFRDLVLLERLRVLFDMGGRERMAFRETRTREHDGELGDLI